jgi:hypothetical protein
MSHNPRDGSQSSILQVKTLAVDGHDSAPLHLHGPVIERMNVSTVTGSSPYAMPASAFPSGLWLYNFSGTITFPSASAIVEAFAAAGCTLQVGDSFNVYYTNIGTQVVRYTPGSGVSDFQSISDQMTAPRGEPASSGRFQFEYTGTNTFFVCMLVSNGVWV